MRAGRRFVLKPTLPPQPSRIKQSANDKKIYETIIYKKLERMNIIWARERRRFMRGTDLHSRGRQMRYVRDIFHIERGGGGEDQILEMDGAGGDLRNGTMTAIRNNILQANLAINIYLSNL
jgi:hypothetical protein